MALVYQRKEQREGQAEADQDFISHWQAAGGSPTELSRAMGISMKNVFHRRRRVEERTGVMLGAPYRGAQVISDLTPEFPDWQELEIKNGLLIMFSDSHLIPHRKSGAHKALVKLVHELQPDALVDGGDLLDFASISKHHRIGWDKQISVREEIKWAKDCLEELKSLGPKKMKTLKTQGNHDQRYSGHLANAGAVLYEGVAGFKLEDHLEGWPVSWAIKVNDDELFISHRWKGGLHGPFNNTLWAGVSHATGHQHKQQIYPLTDLRGDRWGIDVGCLSSIYSPHFRFMEGRPRNYRSGFAIFRFVNYKLRHPELVRVIDEKAGLVEHLKGVDIQV